MQKCGGVVILMNESNIKYLVGNSSFEYFPLPIFSEKICEFLDELSRALRKNARKMNDVTTFAFWCRKSNISKIKESYMQNVTRIGKGLIFHIAPSNVPINFAFTLALGLLAGNANIVRVPEKKFVQIAIVCDAINEILKNKKYAVVKTLIKIVSYPHDENITAFFSGKCNVRVIWGGNHTIKEIRKSELPPRATELTFADRYSFAILNAESVSRLSEEELGELVRKFYNDTYLLDQNACSSPHLILWMNGSMEVYKRFWSALEKVAINKYDFSEMKAMDKYTILCEQMMDNGQADEVYGTNNILKVIQMNSLPDHLEKIRGKFGLFFQYGVKEELELESILMKMDEGAQTCITYGINKNEIAEIILQRGIRGIDRIVDVGRAMEIGHIWDGFDVIASLSRIIL